MKVLFVEYPKCSTCKKAGKWLQEHGVGYDDRHIVEQNPTAEELKEWHEKSGLPLKRFFNTSGQVYRNNGIKDKLSGMSEKEQYALLATDGMLVKRPIVVGEDFVLVGFKEKSGKRSCRKYFSNMLWEIKRESPTSQLPGILQLHSIYIFSNPVKGGISSCISPADSTAFQIGFLILFFLQRFPMNPISNCQYVILYNIFRSAFSIRV